MQAAATTASTQNKPCQPQTPTSSPPTSGPSAAPIAEAAPHSDTARSWAFPVLATESRLNPQARIVEPAAPWIARPAITPHPLVDRAISTHETTKRIKPPRKRRADDRRRRRVSRPSR